MPNVVVRLYKAIRLIFPDPGVLLTRLNATAAAFSGGSEYARLGIE